MLKGELGRQSRTSIYDTLGVGTTVSAPMSVGDKRRREFLVDSARVPNVVVGGLKRISGWMQNVALIAFVVGSFGEPIVGRVSPSMETLVGQLTGSFNNLADRLNQREINSVEELNEKDLDTIVDGALLVFGRVGGPGFLHSIDSNEMTAAQVSAFEAAYRAGLASKSIILYREQYYANNPDLPKVRDIYVEMGESLEICESQGLSARDCVGAIRRAIFENRRNVPGMENMREEDIMPEALKSYLSEKPLSGSLSGNAVAENTLWDGRRRLGIKREQARRAKRLGIDQRSAIANRVARRLR